MCCEPGSCGLRRPDAQCDSCVARSPHLEKVGHLLFTHPSFCSNPPSDIVDESGHRAESLEQQLTNWVLDKQTLNAVRCWALRAYASSPQSIRLTSPSTPFYAVPSGAVCLLDIQPEWPHQALSAPGTVAKLTASG